MTILLIEDDAVQQRLLLAMLTSFQYNAFAVATTADARVYLQTFRPDVILVDIRLKTATGWEDGTVFAQTLHDIPFVYVTSHTDALTLAAAIQTAPYGYLVKPIHETELYAAIQAARLRHLQSMRTQAKYDYLVERVTEELLNIMGVEGDFSLADQVAHYERLLIWSTLKKFEGNRIATAKALGISLRTLQRKLDDTRERGSAGLKTDTQRFTVS